MESTVVDYKQMLLDMFNLPQDAMNMINEEGMFEEWWRRSATFKNIIPLHHFKDEYYDGNVGNFVYYRDSGMVFNTLNPADHERFMAGLYNLHLLKMGRRQLYDTGRRNLTCMLVGACDGQDFYIRDGLGVYQSSCGKDVYRHKNMTLNALEQNVFGDMNQYIHNF